MIRRLPLDKRVVHEMADPDVDARLPNQFEAVAMHVEQEIELRQPERAKQQDQAHHRKNNLLGKFGCHDVRG